MLKIYFKTLYSHTTLCVCMSVYAAKTNNQLFILKNKISFIYVLSLTADNHLRQTFFFLTEECVKPYTMY